LNFKLVVHHVTSRHQYMYRASFITCYYNQQLHNKYHNSISQQSLCLIYIPTYFDIFMKPSDSL